MSAGSNRKIRTVCPLTTNCPSADGVVATIEDGRVTKIEGDRSHPWSKGFICPKGRDEWQVLYHPRRLTNPLLKTSSGWQEIPWSDAIETAADRLGEVRNRFDPLSICSTLPYLSISLFTRSLGSPNEMDNTDLCMGPAEVADRLTYGDVITIYHSTEDFRNSKCVLLVGTNMPHSCGGQWQDVVQAKKNGAKLIVVDPRRCEAAEVADIYLQIRPGTDGALALAMLNVVIKEDLYDKDFVTNYCLGFDKLSEHVQQYTLEWAAEVTSLPAEEIVRVSRMYAGSGPASYRGNIGAYQHSNSTQTARAFAALIAITGNIDVPGGNRLPEPPPADYSVSVNNAFPKGTLGKACVPREIEEQTLGAGCFPLWTGPDSVMRKPHNPSVINAMLTDEPYPVKAWVIMGANPALTYASAGKVIEAMKRLEFMMVLAYTPSPTSDLADLVLPLTHPFEQNGVRFSAYGNWLSATPRLIEPPAGCRDDINILHDIAERMVQKGYIEQNFIPWRDNDELIEASFKSADLSYHDLCEAGPIVKEPTYRKYVKQGFRTATGKVELYSSVMEHYGYEPLPSYKECQESPRCLPRFAERYPLYLTTRRCQDIYLSRSPDYDWIREKSSYPQLHIHPDAARERGIGEGDKLVIETPKGSVQHVAKITKNIHPQVVSGVYGWWLPEKETLENGYLETNINAIMSYDPPYDPETGINRIQGVMCQVRKR